VLDGIDLDVTEGTVFALLGPNGAGKTTTVHILSTLIPADAGEVRIAGHDLAREPDAVRAAISLTGQFSAVDKLLTGEENLRLIGRPAPPAPTRGLAAGGRASGALRHRRGGSEARADLLRRDAAQIGPSDASGR
jgi:ABC-type multidrug transport system ATPase subunit